MSNSQTQENFNSDLRLIRSISAHKAEQQRIHPRSVQQLAALLKHKKKQNQAQRPQEIQSGREWLIKKGIDLEPLLTRVAQIKKQVIQPKTTKVAQSYFHVDFNQEPVEQYLNKAEEYSNMNLMQSIMSKGESRKKSTFKLLQRIIDENTEYTTWQCQSSPQTRGSYINITKQIAKTEQQALSISRRMLKQFQNTFMTTQNNSLWEILQQQLSVYSSTMTQPVNMTRMLISSLKLIHQAFQRKLHGQDFDQMVNSKYISKVDHKNLQNKVSLWPKVWMAYCAGQKNKVQNLLSSDKRDQRDLMQLYQLTQQAISNGKPKKLSYSPHYDIQDIFYQQFIYNITGQSRYSHNFFADETSLELVLIIVRTLGIFYQSQKNKFEDIRSKIVKKYRDLGADPNMIRNILYLMDYGSITKMGVNALMSKQDYLHFLIVVSGFPELVREPSLKSNLTKSLVSFIIQLLAQKRGEYIYYIKLLPEDVQVQETSSIAISVDGLDSFDWDGLKQLLKEQQFNKIVLATIEKYRLRQGAELKAASKLVQLCSDYDKAFNYLLILFINHYLNRKKYSNEEVLKAEQLGLSWSNQRGFGNVYQLLFQFVVSIRQLNTLIVRRNQQKLRQFIASCQFVDIKFNQPNSLYQRMLKILDQNKGLELYYYFLRLVVKGAEIYTARSGDSEKLSILKSLLLEQVEQIQRLPWVRSQFQGSNLKALREQLVERILDLL